MAIIFINGIKYNVDSSKNLLHTCLSVNLDVPYFCWHPDLGSVGLCRLCAVKQYNNKGDKFGRIIMSCITSPVDNMLISTVDMEVYKFRKGIIELLMTNHPHDCPICEEGGNCHLQDMTVMNRHYNRRYIYSKRIHRNQYLGKFITHNMNRCIGCYRCVRYYKDYAGGSDFGVYGISNNIYFGRFEDGSLQSEHSGNLIEVCPTGVFTDKLSSKNYNRKWDLQHAPSICQHCSVGCNIIVGEKYGKISKIENRYHSDINRYFLCDLGRFGYSYTNSSNRYKYPFQTSNNNVNILNEDDSIQLVSKILKKSKNIIGIGSIRTSLENNFALQKLVGSENFSNGMLEIDRICVNLIIDILKNSGLYIPTLKEIEEYDMVLIIGEDITQTSPRIDLSIRQLHSKQQKDTNLLKSIPEWHSSAILNTLNHKKSIYIIHTHETKLDEIAQVNYYGSIHNQEILVNEIFNYIKNSYNNLKQSNSNLFNQVEKIGKALLSSKKPLIVSGSHSKSVNLIKSTVNIANKLKILKKDVGIVLLTPGVNSIGLGIIDGISIESVLDRIFKNKVDTLIILESDLYRYYYQKKINEAFKKVKNIIVFDHQITATTEKSTIFFPTTSIFESNGTVVNYESRAQRFFSVFDPKIYNAKSCILESWKWLYKIYFNVHHLYDNFQFDDVVADCIENIFTLEKLKYLAPSANFRISGQQIARYSHRASSRTAIFSNVDVHEPKQKIDVDTMFAFSMEGSQQPNKSIDYTPFTWSPGWNSTQSVHKYVLDNDHYHSGIRLLNCVDRKKEYFFDKITINNFNTNYWHIVPYYVIFHSEELSQKSKIIKIKKEDIRALISIQYKSKFHLSLNSMIKFNHLGEQFMFRIQFSSKLPLKQIGLPVGLYNLPISLIGSTIKNIRGIM